MPLKPMKKTAPKSSSSNSPSGRPQLSRQSSTVSTSSGSTALKNQPIQDRLIEMIKGGNTEGVINLLTDNLGNLSFLNSYHSKSGKHPLAVAAEEGRFELITELLKHEKVVEIDLYDKFGMSSILYAAKNGEFQILQELYQKGGDIFTLTPTNETALYLAAQYNKLDIVRYLISCELPIEAQNSRNETALSIAIKYEYYEVAELLLENGANINTRRTNGDSPLFAAVFDNRLHTVNFILKHGGEVNLRNDNQETPLMIACRHGYLEIAQKLLDSGANVNEIDNGGKTALIQATIAQKPVIIPILIQRGALVDLKDCWGYSALSICCKVKNLKFEIIHHLLAAKCDINSLDRCKNTPLIHACKNQNAEVAKFLVEQGADVALQNIDGKAAIDYFPELLSSS